MRWTRAALRARIGLAGRASQGACEPPQGNADDGADACRDFRAALVPGISERTPLVSNFVTDGIAGGMLPPADPSDTASAVARFLADAETRKAMGSAGLTRAKRDFGEKAMIDGFTAAATAAADRTLWAAR